MGQFCKPSHLIMQVTEIKTKVLTSMVIVIFALFLISFVKDAWERKKQYDLFMSLAKLEKKKKHDKTLIYTVSRLSQSSSMTEDITWSSIGGLISGFFYGYLFGTIEDAFVGSIMFSTINAIVTFSTYFKTRTKHFESAINRQK